MSKFKVGSKVAWVSQAAGIWREKHGEVIRIVPLGEDPLGGMSEDMRRDLWTIAGGRLGPPRDGESYLVSVRDGKEKGAPLLAQDQLARRGLTN